MVKTYVLLDALNSSAPIYQHIGDGKRVHLTKIQNWSPYLRITFHDKDGKTRTIRYKEGLDEIDQKVQIKEYETPANLPFTPREYSDLTFKLGTLTTNKENVQKYLENYPAFDKFEGFSDDHRTPCFKLLDEVAESKKLNTEIRKRVKAASKVLNIGLEEKQDLLLRMNGSFFVPPTTELDCENLLMEMVDEMDEKGLEEVLRDELTPDESVSILIGKLLNAKLLSFDKSPNQISKKVKGNWVDVKEISSDYTQEERKRYFLEFLTSDSGKMLLAELRQDIDSPKKEVLPKVEVVVEKPLTVKDRSEGETTMAMDETLWEQPKVEFEEAEEPEIKEKEVNTDNSEAIKLAEAALEEAIANKAHHITIKSLRRKLEKLQNQ